MTRLVWSPQARRDLAHQFVFIAEHDLAAAERVVGLAEQRAEWLTEWPYAGSRLGRSALRSFPVRRTPLILVYESNRRTTTILRVVHAKQNWR